MNSLNFFKSFAELLHVLKVRTGEEKAGVEESKKKETKEKGKEKCQHNDQKTKPRVETTTTNKRLNGVKKKGGKKEIYPKLRVKVENLEEVNTRHTSTTSKKKNNLERRKKE
jgi:hypothetical protein